MSEEDIQNGIENLIEVFVHCNRHLGMPNIVMPIDSTINYEKALKGILDLYNKEKEKNKELLYKLQQILEEE